MKLTLKSIALVALLGIISCEKDDPEVINEVEVFSNFTLTLTPEHDEEEESDEDDHEDEESVVFHWHDEDGDLVVDAEEIEDGGELEPGVTYHAVISLDEHDEDEEEVLATSISFTNSTSSDDDDHDHDHSSGEVDAEIIEEVDEHLFFYEAPAGLTVEYLEDEEIEEFGALLGLETEFVVGDTFNGGTITITLLHQPENKSGTTLSEIGGEVDIDIDFVLGVHSDEE